jgi:hypothetical protein
VTEVESIKVLKCRVRVYQREFERSSGAYCLTNTHGMLVVVTQNMCGVPVGSVVRDTSIIEGLLRKMTA